MAKKTPKKNPAKKDFEAKVADLARIIDRGAWSPPDRPQKQARRIAAMADARIRVLANL